MFAFDDRLCRPEVWWTPPCNTILSDALLNFIAVSELASAERTSRTLIEGRMWPLLRFCKLRISNECRLIPRPEYRYLIFFVQELDRAST
jgi:hypothetical protein